VHPFQNGIHFSSILENVIVNLIYHPVLFNHAQSFEVRSFNYDLEHRSTTTFKINKKKLETQLTKYNFEGLKVQEQ
jgi:hypothetical protein